MTNSKSLTMSSVDLKEGAMATRSVDGREIVVCRTKDGIYALDNLCTHADARLSEGRLRGNRLICPLHGASFDVRDGRVLGAPAIKALDDAHGRCRRGTNRRVARFESVVIIGIRL